MSPKISPSSTWRSTRVERGDAAEAHREARRARAADAARSHGLGSAPSRLRRSAPLGAPPRRARVGHLGAERTDPTGPPLAARARRRLVEADPAGRKIIMSDEHHTEDRHAVLAQPAEALGQARHHERAEDHAGDVARAAEHHRGQEQIATAGVKSFGLMRWTSPRTAHPRTTDAAPIANAQHLELERRHAHELGGVLVLTDRRPGPPDAAVLPALHQDDHNDGQAHQQVVVGLSPARRT